MRCPHHDREGESGTQPEDRRVKSECAKGKSVGPRTSIKRIGNNNKWHFSFSLFRFLLRQAAAAAAFSYAFSHSSCQCYFVLIHFPVPFGILLRFSFVFAVAAVWYPFQFVEQRAKQFQLSIRVAATRVPKKHTRKECAITATAAATTIRSNNNTSKTCPVKIGTKIIKACGSKIPPTNRYCTRILVEWKKKKTNDMFHCFESNEGDEGSTV